MKRATVITILIVTICIITGCIDTSGFKKRAYETKALSMLKMFQTYSALYYIETGQYPRLQDLYEWGGGEIDETFYSALDEHENPVPLAGYLFSSIDIDSDGRPLDYYERTGLCAYPAQPGTTGDYIFIILADPRPLEQASGTGESFVSHGEEWTTYKAKYEDIGGPLRRWPGPATLSKFQVLQKLTPQQGLQKARQLYESVPKMQ